MLFELDRDSRTPLYSQIVDRVRDMIVSGTLGVGDRLPANRELAKSLGVNRTTVTTAYAELTADGLISSEVGRGTFVRARPMTVGGPAVERVSPMPWDALLSDQGKDRGLSGLLRIKSTPEAVSLAYALPDTDLIPLDDFRRCVDRVLRTEGRALISMGSGSGYPPLQEFIASKMSLDGARVAADRILITSGCQQALTLVRNILVGPGDEVAIENPTYPGALGVFCGDGSRYISVPMAEDGLDLDVLEDILSQRQPKLLYTIPSFQNPTGLTMDLAARRRLIGIAARHRIPIIEDDIYSELRHEGASPPSLKALDEFGLVIYVSSFSKVGFPGLRVGWIAAPPIVIDHLLREKEKADLHTNLLAQAAIFEFARRGLLQKHIKRMRRVLLERRQALVEALESHFPPGASWTTPEGGMAVWVRLPEPLNASQLLVEAAGQGVIFSPGEYFYANHPARNTLRVSFSMADSDSIRAAVKRLGRIIRERLATFSVRFSESRAGDLRALV